MRQSPLAIVHATLLVSVAATARAASPVLFLDRCAAGCAYGPGSDDSRTNTSSLSSGTSTLSAFAHGDASFFDARQIPSVAYTDPEVAWAGKTEEECKTQGIEFGRAVFPWAASGRAIANGRDEGFTKLIFDAATHRVIGGGIVGTHAGDMIGEVALAIEMGADAVDIGKTIHPHPTLGESIGMAAEVAHGSCTDLPPQKR